MSQEHDGEGRVITAEFETFYLVTTYVPNAGSLSLSLPFSFSLYISIYISIRGIRGKGVNFHRFPFKVHIMLMFLISHVSLFFSFFFNKLDGKKCSGRKLVTLDKRMDWDPKFRFQFIYWIILYVQ